MRMETVRWRSLFRVAKSFCNSSPPCNKDFHNASSTLVNDYFHQSRLFYISTRGLDKGFPLEYRFLGRKFMLRSLGMSIFEENNGNSKLLRVYNIKRFTSNAKMGSGVNSGENEGSVYRVERLETKVRKNAGQKSQATFIYLVAMVVGMVGITYASVPLYRKFCQATGYGGTVQRRETVEEKIARHSQEDPTLARELVVQFNADVADGMPWKFTPCQHEVRVKPGQSTLAFYTAENRSSEPITGVSTYNVTPMKAGIYFNKIQCFCFEEQRLLPGEKLDMPVFFYIDPEFATDPKMNGINNLILSYTFFKVEDQDRDD